MTKVSCPCIQRWAVTKPCKSTKGQGSTWGITDQERQQKKRQRCCLP